jgi:hypothetical protein
MQEEKNNKGPRYAVITLIIVVILILILILFLYMIRSPLIFRSGATTITPSTTELPATSILSSENSYIFASPLRAKTGGEKIRVTVFILDTKGLGMQGKSVTVGSGNGLTVTPIQPVTDAQGRATFDVDSAGTPGVFIIQASANGVTLTQKATITFD